MRITPSPKFPNIGAEDAKITKYQPRINHLISTVHNCPYTLTPITFDRLGNFNQQAEDFLTSHVAAITAQNGSDDFSPLAIAL